MAQDRFADRPDAGRRLAARLLHLKDRHPVVLALPRGGVPVGYAVAEALKAPLDVILVRKIGAPGQPELAIGAVVDGDQPEIVLNPQVVVAFGLTDRAIGTAAQQQLQEIDRRRALYRQGRPPVDVRGRTAIVVDDGIATGATMRVALHAIRRAGAARVVLATPVVAPETLADLAREADETVAVLTPSDFTAVGQFYDDFAQTTDEAVVTLLERAAAREAGSTATRSE